MESRSRTWALPFLAALLAGTALSADEPKANHPQAFTGEITDSLCAPYKSHEHMMKEMKSMGTDKETCIAKCLQLGAKYVLYDQNSQAVYSLKDQEKARPFAGHRVRITGTLEKKKIEIEDIKAID